MAQEEKYRCTECGVEFTSSEQLEQHNQQQHQQETRQVGQLGTRQGQSQRERGERQGGREA